MKHILSFALLAVAAFTAPVLLAAPAPKAPAPAAPAAPAVNHAPAVSDAVPDKNGVRRMVILRGLDKVTGRAIDVAVPIGVPVRFGSLTITARYCYTVPPEEPPETTAFVQIDDGKPGDQLKRVFSGWMFASTPALSALEHPIYDVWVITCKTDQPGPAEPPPAAQGPAPAKIPDEEPPPGPPPPGSNP